MRPLLTSFSVFLLCSAAFATTPPPFPNKLGSNVAADPTFASSGAFSTNWHPGGCATWDGTTTHTVDGSGSAKLASCGIGAMTNYFVPSVHEYVTVTAWIKTDAAQTGTFEFDLIDSTHGGLFLNSGSGPSYVQVGQNSTSWVQVGAQFAIPKAHQADTVFSIQIGVRNGGAGTVWVDDVVIAPSWYPVRSFLIYPQRFLWSDKTPPKRYSPGVSPVLGQIDGVSEVDCSGCTLTVKIATAATCSSGVLATITPSVSQYPVPSYWQFTPAQYGALTIGNTYYICAALSGTYTDTYPDLTFIYENATFRSGLQSYIDVDGAWVFNGTRKLPLGSYDSLGSNDTGSASPTWSTGASCTPNEIDAKTCYLKHIAAPVCGSPQIASGIAGLSYAFCAQPYLQRLSWYGNLSLNHVMSDIQGMSVISPCSGCAGGDQLSPWLDAVTTQNVAHFQELNYLFGTAVGGGSAQSQPTFAPSVTPGAGSITANFLFIEITEVAYVNGQGNGGGSAHVETKPSSITTVNLSTAGCAGTNCSAQFSLPACDSVRSTGFYIYTATAATSTPPAQSTWARQYAGGVLVASQETPCSASVTLSSLLVTGIAPPSTDATLISMPTWTSGLTDTQSYTDFFNTMTNASHPGGAGFYIEDEPGEQSVYNAAYVANSVRSNGMLTWCAEYNSSDAQIWRDLCDIIAADPYAYGFSGGSDNYAASPIDNNTETCTSYSGGVGTASFSCRPEAVDMWVRELALDTYGSRPVFPVLNMYATCCGVTAMTYANHYQQALKAIIACKDVGSAGCGLNFWMLGVNSGALETTFFGNGNTITPGAIPDFTTVTTQLNAMAPAMLATVVDSPYLNGGSGQIDGVNGETVTGGAIVSNVKMGSTVHSVCSGASINSIYETSATYPFGAVRFFTTTDINGHQFVFVTNLCTTSYTATFTLVPAASTVQVLNESRQITVSSNQFLDTLGPMSVHVYQLSNIAGMPASTIGGTSKIGGQASIH
jgi:hypothetical protein